MITLDSPTLMDFNPYKAVEEKLQMKVTKKENTFTFKFSNGYQKIKTLKNNMQVKMYYTFLEEVYNENPTNFAEKIEEILKGEQTGERVSITFYPAQMGVRCKVEVSYFKDGERITSSAKRGGNIFACYKHAQKNLHKKLDPKQLQETPAETRVHNAKDDFISYLLKQIEKKDSKIESLEQKVELLQITNDNFIQKTILRYTKCPICGGEQIIKESAEGNHFIGCVNYNEDVEAHKRSGLPYDDFARILHRTGLLRTYEEWRYGL